MKTLKLSILLSLGLIFNSCSGDSKDGNVQMNAKMSYLGNNKLANSVVINQFKLNLKEIKFEMDDNSGNFQGEDNVKFRGPFELDLMAGTVSVTNATLPNLVYDEIEFKMHRNTNPSFPMYGKSIWIKGTINGVPFDFWHTFEDKIEVDFDDQNLDLVLNGNDLTFAVNFDLSNVLSMANLAQANDTDGDGVIEINPNNDDNNKDLSNDLKDLFKNYVKLTY